MKTVFTRSALLQARQKTWSDPARLRALLAGGPDDPMMPESLLAWLGRLAMLCGVPFNYLVPDERMLPPESVRFFMLDWNWVIALLEGAMSIGRDLCPLQTPETMLHKAVQSAVARHLKRSLGKVRAAAFGGAAATVADDALLSGFVLRSKVVREYPQLGANVFDADGNPLMVLRFERLGRGSDVLLCLVAGDACQVQLHEAPQALHYGIDCFNDACQIEGRPVTAFKGIYTFGIKAAANGGTTTNRVTMSGSVTHVDISSCIRSDSRVLSMAELARVILAANGDATTPPGTTAPTSIDSAEMGFEMTEGVGMVTFQEQPTP